MKNSLRKLRGLAAINRHNPKDKKGYNPPAHIDELAQASQDILDMKNCYDSLLSAAAATANSAYEFSEAMREMGTCLLEKTALNDDEESGRVLLMIGKAQFELQKLVDSYRVHVIQTITTPSESLLKELQTVEEMRRQCDDKRNYYKFMLEEHKEKGKSRNSKDVNISSQQLREAQEDYEEEAALFVFRLKSLKQGQCRSLLTQAARHHAAQLNFFRRGVKSLEIVEPRVEVIAQQQHIDYQFSGLEDDDTEDGDDIAYCGNGDGELSFDYNRSDLAQDVDSMSGSSIEVTLDQIDLENAAVPTTDTVQESLDRRQADMLSFNRGIVFGSQSAPILAEKQLELSERIKQMRPSSTRKFCTYVLPTPIDAKISAPTGLGNPSALQIENKGELLSSPLKPNKFVKDLSDKLSSPTRLPKAQSVLKESNINSGPIKLPLPLAEELVLSQSNPSDARKIKRQAFSGPLTNKAWSSNSKVSPSASPPPKSSAKINELHKLPRPPTNSEKTRHPGLIGHSAPLVSRVQQFYTTGKPSTTISPKAAPLPTPPEAISRSFSIPSGGRRRSMSTVAELLEVPRNQNVTDALSSPHLKPMIITSNEPTVSESVAPATKPERMS